MSAASVPQKRFVIIWLLLLLLTGSTVGVAYLDLGPWNFVAGMGIAVIKAGLVAYFFMELRDAKPLTKVFAAGALVWLGLLVLGTITDYLTRPWLAEPPRF
jgi:cytochrome c oxidase subunit IV